MEWQGVALLGAYHGINPGMGWLFAVALGMQQGSARGVWRALLPIALGHGLAVGVVLAIAAAAQLVVPLDTFSGSRSPRSSSRSGSIVCGGTGILCTVGCRSAFATLRSGPS